MQLLSAERRAYLVSVPEPSVTAAYLARTALSDDRSAAYRRLLGEIESALGSMPVEDIGALTAFLDAKRASGLAPTTIRRNVGMLRVFYRWAYEQGRVSADTDLAVLAIKPPPGSSRRAQPKPYGRTEVRQVRATLDERWPKLPDNEAWKWINRWRDGRSPYSRIRSHVIRCQLDAIIGLALYCGLRRAEIFRQEMNWMHDDNDYVMVWDETGPWDGECRSIHYTDSARAQIAPWCRLRSAITPNHAHAWLNLHAEQTVRAPMTRDTFARSLRTYVGPGWTLSRLRATCGVTWAKANLLARIAQSSSDVIVRIPHSGGRCWCGSSRSEGP